MFGGRNKLLRDRKYQLARNKDKLFRKQLRIDRNRRMLSNFDQDFNIRSKWLGLKYLRKAYTPRPWFRIDENK